MAFLACLEGSGLNLIFQKNAYLFILRRSLQNLSTVLLGSLTIENKEMSSGFDWRFSRQIVNIDKKSKTRRKVEP